MLKKVFKKVTLILNILKLQKHLVIRKKIPKSTHGYYLTSLIRLSEDDGYINKIKELMESRVQKGKKDKYYNSRNKS